MSPCFSCICFLSLMPVSGLSLWNHYRAFPQVQSQCLFFNMYLQVFRALWVLRDRFWLTGQYWVGSKHLNRLIILYFSRLEHRSYLESAGLAMKNNYVDRHTVYRIFRNWYLFLTSRAKALWVSLTTVLFHGVRLCQICSNALSKIHTWTDVYAFSL